VLYMISHYIHRCQGSVEPESEKYSVGVGGWSVVMLTRKKVDFEIVSGVIWGVFSPLFYQKFFRLVCFFQRLTL